MATNNSGAPAPGAHRQYESAAILIALVDAGPDIERRVVIPDQTTLADLHLVIQAAMGWTNSHLRRVVIPDQTTLADLHLVIQAAMGWTNSHLHAFTAPDGVTLR